MGIKYLNRYLTNHCSANSISKQPLSEFRNKVFVIDASIYLYRFVESNMLVEGFYNMVSIFKKYRITPIFVFDGKPPVEKKELLEKRRIEKNRAEKAYNDLKIQLDEIGVCEDTSAREKHTEILSEMETLKKRFVRIKPSDIQTIKQLLSAYGTQYIESAGEADQLCAYMVLQNLAWACVSDDMDMFLYGCPRVIRHISLIHHTGILYNTSSIFDELQISYDTFRDITILSGTDYNLHQKIYLYDTMKWYRKYIENASGEDYTKSSFYSWLVAHAKYTIDPDALSKIRDMFDLTLFQRNNTNKLLAIGQEIRLFRSGTPDKATLQSILREYGFIFI